MASIAATSIALTGSSSAPVETTLSASDTLTYQGANKRQLMEIANGTGGSLDVLLLGDAVDSFSVSGYGEIDPSAGKTITVADGETQSFLLGGIDKYLSTGTDAVTVTGGDGATVKLYNIA